jgi:transcriptional regulator with XRE-family HTH domain
MHSNKGFEMKKKRKSSNRMTSKGHPNPVDVHVGARVRLRRTLLGLTQITLGEQLGLSYQQVMKYEQGLNRVSSSRLFDLCRILNVPIAYFYDEMGTEVSKQSPAGLAGQKPKAVDKDADPAAKRETLELVRAYYGIPDQAVRQRLTNMIRAIASTE